MAKGSSGFTNMTKVEKDKGDIRKRLEALADERGDGGGYHYDIQERNWDSYGKSRTYFKIIETRDNSKRRVEYDYGYYDNKEEQYVAGRGKGDVYSNFGIRGNRFDIDEAIKKKKRKK